MKSWYENLALGLGAIAWGGTALASGFGIGNPRVAPGLGGNGNVLEFNLKTRSILAGLIAKQCNRKSSGDSGKKQTESFSVGVTDLAHDVEAELKSTPDLRDLDPQSIAIAGGVISLVLSMADSRLNVDTLYNQILNRTASEGVNQGLLLPALDLIDQSMALGNPEIAMMVNPVIALIHPSIGQLLSQRLGLPLEFLGNPKDDPSGFLLSVEGELKARVSKDPLDRMNFGTHLRSEISEIQSALKLAVGMDSKSPPNMGAHWVDPVWADQSVFGVKESKRDPILSNQWSMSARGTGPGPFSANQGVSCVMDCANRHSASLTYVTQDAIVSGAAAGISGPASAGLTAVAGLFNGGRGINRQYEDCANSCKENAQKAVNDYMKSLTESVRGTSAEKPEKRPSSTFDSVKADAERKSLRDVHDSETKAMERRHDDESNQLDKNRSEAEVKAKMENETKEAALQRHEAEDQAKADLEERQKQDREENERRQAKEKAELEAKQEKEREGESSIPPDAAADMRGEKVSRAPLPLPLKLKAQVAPAVLMSGSDDDRPMSFDHDPTEYEQHVAWKSFVDAVCGSGMPKLNGLDLTSSHR